MEPDLLIHPSQGCSSYQFGQSLAAHGDELLVGAPWDYNPDDATFPPPTVGLLSRRDGVWSVSQVLVATGPVQADGFGRSLALGNAFAVVGAPGNENGDEPTFDFVRAGGAPFQFRAALDAPERDEVHNDVFERFGESVAADARHVIVGAPLAAERDGNDGDPCGAVYVFDRTSSSVSPVATLRGARAGEQFGTSVALSGDLLVIGGYSNELFVHRRDAAGGWHALCSVTGGGTGDKYGAHMAMDGARFAVTDVGRVEVFEVLGAACTMIASLELDETFDPSSLAFKGDRLAIGDAMFSAPGGPLQTGRVGLFRVSSDGSIHHEEWLAVASCDEYARFGSAVALGPDYLAAGAPGMNDDDEGFVAMKAW